MFEEDFQTRDIDVTVATVHLVSVVVVRRSYSYTAAGSLQLVWRHFKMLEVWRLHAASADDCGIDAGHYLAEEAPAELLAHLLRFLQDLPRS